MTQPKRQLNLNLFLMGTGHHEASWRHPDAQPGRSLDLSYYLELAQTAERAKLDSVFLADGLASWSNAKSSRQGGLEPFTFLSALSAVTKHIGLIGTVSTTYNEPFHVARKFASLDHLSQGRAGWNIVTSGNEQEAQNFGREEHLEHSARYGRANEFLEVTTKLYHAGFAAGRLKRLRGKSRAGASAARLVPHRIYRQNAARELWTGASAKPVCSFPLAERRLLVPRGISFVEARSRTASCRAGIGAVLNHEREKLPFGRRISINSSSSPRRNRLA